MDTLENSPGLGGRKHLVASRGATTEELGAAATNPVAVSVAEGGRQVTVWDIQGVPTGYQLQANGQWHATVGVAYGLGGTYNSMGGNSEDLDSLVVARLTPLSTTQERVAVYVRAGPTGSPFDSIASITLPWLQDNQAFCSRGDAEGNCHAAGFWDPTGIRINPRIAMDPNGRRALLYVSRTSITGHIVSVACPASVTTPYLLCFNADETYETLDTDLYWVDLPTGTIKPLKTLPYEVVRAGISDDGTQLIFGGGHWRDDHAPSGQTLTGDCSLYLMDLRTLNPTQLGSWSNRCSDVVAPTIAP